MAEEKAEIRRQMRERRRLVSETERLSTGQKIAQALELPVLDLFLRSEMICVYLSAGHEIPMRWFCSRAWAVGKRLCVPAWDELAKSYLLFEFSPETRLAVGKFGIREPVDRRPVASWDVSAFIVPGLAFDTRGGRLGYGGGYYDRMLTGSSALRIGVCYDWQLRKEPLPQEDCDQPLDWVVTDKRAVDCAAARKGTKQ